MAEGNFWSRLFRREVSSSDDSDSIVVREQETMVEDDKTNMTESEGVSLQDVVNFVAELQSYYYSDICKSQTNMVVQTSIPQNRINFIHKKIKQDKRALSQIDEILDLVKQNEREYQSIFGKSVYSFYDEIEKEKLKTIQEKVFKIILRLYAVNTKLELKNIILKRIEIYKQAWNIAEEIQIEDNYNAILVDENNGIEKYQFGEFTKNVVSYDNDKELSSTQVDKIRKMNFEFEKEIQTENIWVYVSSVSRLELNYMRRTCFIDNKWEYEPNKNGHLFLDVVKVTDFEKYLKGILQIVLTKANHAVISVVVPTDDMKNVIGKIEEKGDKVEIYKRYRFYLKERSGLYKDNLLTTRIDKRFIPEKLRFISYLKFKKVYF